MYPSGPLALTGHSEVPGGTVSPRWPGRTLNDRLGDIGGLADHPYLPRSRTRYGTRHGLRLIRLGEGNAYLPPLTGSDSPASKSVLHAGNVNTGGGYTPLGPHHRQGHAIRLRPIQSHRNLTPGFLPLRSCSAKGRTIWSPLTTGPKG